MRPKNIDCESVTSANTQSFPAGGGTSVNVGWVFAAKALKPWNILTMNDMEKWHPIEGNIKNHEYKEGSVQTELLFFV